MFNKCLCTDFLLIDNYMFTIALVLSFFNRHPDGIYYESSIANSSKM